MKQRSIKANIRIILQRYKLRPRRLKSYRSLYRPNAACRAVTNKGIFLVKPFRRRETTRLTTFQQMKKVAHYIGKLQLSGYPNMPRWSRTSAGSYYVFRNRRPYYVTEWIRGRVMNFDEHDYELLGAAIARLHTICSDKLSPMPLHTQQQINILRSQEHGFRQRLSGKNHPMGRWFEDHANDCFVLSNEAWNIFNLPEVLQVIMEEGQHPALVHGDITYPNVMIVANRLVLIDWDGLRKDSTYNEITKTLLNVTHYNPILMGALLRGYESVKPLTPPERMLISGLYRLPREAWACLRNNTFFTRGKETFRIMAITWQERLNAIRWIDEWARQVPNPPIAVYSNPIPASEPAMQPISDSTPYTEPILETPQPIAETPQPILETPQPIAETPMQVEAPEKM
jgi:Ser/Thr protein kinase RdoA (MazF antagonist)